MNKKVFGLTLGALLLALSFPVEAQHVAKVYRIGFLALGAPPPEPVPATFPFWEFRQALRELKYLESQNLILESRWAAGKREQLPALAAELVRLNVDIIVASGFSAVRAAKNATRTIPIVMAGAPDPVAFELIANLARPGGNVTGLADSPGRDLEGKRLELLKETVPRMSRVAVILDSASRLDIRPTKDAAHALGLVLILSPETATPTEFQNSFSLISRERAQAVYAPETPINVRYRDLIAELAVKHRLPTMYGSREFVEGGGLMSYGPKFSELFRRAAFYVDKILQGTKPADLPVEQPSKFELVMNLKTAKRIGLAIPPNVLARADGVIK
jgi:putative ABC transport system substrate-binding protein